MDAKTFDSLAAMKRGFDTVGYRFDEIDERFGAVNERVDRIERFWLEYEHRVDRLECLLQIAELAAQR